jgi:hypothetical protein
MKIKAIITGATGMVGEGVLLACLDHPDVEQVLVINRKPGGVSHPKLREIKHAYIFRPGFMKATPGQKNVKSYYTFFAGLYPIGRILYPAGFCTVQEVGLAIIKAVSKGYPKQILEVEDICLTGRPNRPRLAPDQSRSSAAPSP